MAVILTITDHPFLLSPDFTYKYLDGDQLWDVTAATIVSTAGTTLSWQGKVVSEGATRIQQFSPEEVSNLQNPDG
jgi:hypothetical protein